MLSEVLKLNKFLILFVMIVFVTSFLSVSYFQESEALKSKGTTHLEINSIKVCGDRL